MRSLLPLAVLLLAATVSAAEPARRVFVVTGVSAGDGSAERRAIVEQFDRRFRDELHRRGATVTDQKDTQAAILLRPSLEVLPRGLKLNLVGSRTADQKLLGSISAKASGASRNAQLRALVTRACLEAEQFESGASEHGGIVSEHGDQKVEQSPHPRGVLQVAVNSEPDRL